MSTCPRCGVELLNCGYKEGQFETPGVVHTDARCAIKSAGRANEQSSRADIAEAKLQAAEVRVAELEQIRETLHEACEEYEARIVAYESSAAATRAKLEWAREAMEEARYTLIGYRPHDLCACGACTGRDQTLSNSTEALAALDATEEK